MMSAENSLPLVSIVICGYNQEAYFEQAIESVLTQTYPATQVIALDNGSSDGTQALLEKYRDHPRVRLILNQRNLNTTICCNQGVRAAEGDYVGILYADDFYLPTKIEKQMQAFGTLPASYGVVYTPGFRLNVDTGQKWVEKSYQGEGWIGEDFFLHFHKQGPISPISPLFKKQCLIDHPFQEEFFVEAEAIYWRVALTYQFHYLDEPLVVMRDHDSNMGKAIKKNREYGKLLLRSYLQKKEVGPQKAHAAKVYFARSLRNYGWQAVRLSSDLPWARSCFREAIGWHFPQLFHPRTVIGFMLSLCPPTLISKINTLVQLFKPAREKMVMKESYS